ncbi:MAG: glycosyltransferase family 4 protein [Chthonomonadales bacterium]
MDLSTLKICFIAGTLGRGGAERQLYYILRCLVQQGARPHLFSLTRGEFWEEHIRALGVPVEWVGRRASRLARAAAIARHAAALKPNVIQSQHFHTNLYATVAARINGLKEIGALRSNARSEVRANGPLFGALSLRGPRHLAANSLEAIRNAQALGVPSNRLHLLPNVVDVDEFCPPMERPPRPFTILGVGRMGPEKRFDRFVKVVARARLETSGRVRGVLVGAGPEQMRLERLCQEYHLTPDGLVFAGPENCMVRRYHQADILLLTSDYEGTPNVVLEAMACGMPVIAAGVGGVRDIVHDGDTGVLLDPDDVSGMVDWVVRLAADEELCRAMGKRARVAVLQHYSPKAMPGHLSRLYEAVLG